MLRVNNNTLLFSHGLYLISIVIFFITLSILVLNANRAFDITDESFNLLWAMQPENVMGTVSQFGYYTGFLYKFSGESITIFRLMGIACLVIAGSFFCFSLERYWKQLSGDSSGFLTNIALLAVILAGALAYYKDWRWLTPTYNWLVLIGTLIVAIGLLEEGIRSYSQKLTFTNRSIFNALIIGSGLGLAFLAKPTTPVILFIITILWVLIHPMKVNRMFFLFIASITSGLIILSHGYLSKGSIVDFYNDLRYGLELGSILAGGSNIESLFVRTGEDLYWLVTDILRFSAEIYSGLLILFIFLFFLKKRGWSQIAKIILTISLSILFVVLWYKLFIYHKWTRAWVGYGGLQIVFLLFLSSFFCWIIWKNGENKYKYIPFRHLVTLSIFLLLLAFAFVFGTGNDFWAQLSAAYIFLAAASYFMARWIDSFAGNKVLSSALAVLLTLSVLSLVYSQYKSPRRQIAGINDQINKVSFLAGGGELYTDNVTAKYISELKTTAQNAGWRKGMALIDMTGGSPGATVILGARVLGNPWMLGGYSGSYDFAETVLSGVPEDSLRSAWILEAPEGRMRISNDILSSLNLDFPDSYLMVAELRTGYRDEKQMLWMPK